MRELGWFAKVSNKGNILILMIFVLFAGIFPKPLLAEWMEVPPTCVKNYNHTSDIVFFGKNDKLTFDACNNQSIEAGYAHFYTFLDQLPCGGNCRTNAPFGLIATYPDFSIPGGMLKIAGDVSEDMFYISAGGLRLEEPGEYYCGAGLQGVSIGNLGEEVKEGEVDFTYIQSAAQNFCNDECKSYWAGGTIVAVDNCSCGRSEEKPMFVVKGSFKVAKNPRRTLDLSNILFDVSTARSGLCSFNPIYYNSDSEPFARTINYGTWDSSTMSCGEYKQIEHDYCINTALRVKVPAWSKDVCVGDALGFRSLPDYMSNEGWACVIGEYSVSLSLGELGTIYFCCGTPSDNTSTPKTHHLSETGDSHLFL